MVTPNHNFSSKTLIHNQKHHRRRPQSKHSHKDRTMIAAAAAVNGAAKTATTSQAYLEGSKVKETKALIADLCRHFYHPGWVSGTGGSITIKVHDDAVPKPQQLIVMSPSGVQKERMMEEDMYVLSTDGTVLSEPLSKPWPNKPPKCSDCGPLFLKVM